MGTQSVRHIKSQITQIKKISPGLTTYSALGQRVVHTWPGSEVDWLYHPGGSEMADFMPVPWNDWGNTYFNLNGRPIAKYIGGVADGEAFFFHSNHLGSTSMITYYNGDVVQKELFYPYGQNWATGGSVGSYRFPLLRERVSTVRAFSDSGLFARSRTHGQLNGQP